VNVGFFGFLTDSSKFSSAQIPTRGIARAWLVKVLLRER
jgi:hypothetical protein